MNIDQLKNKIGFQIGFMQFSGKTEEQTIEDITQLAVDYAEQFIPKWIKIESQKDMPEPNQEVLIVCDYTKYGRGRKINHARVHLTIEPRPYGGPNALTGSGNLQGIYFSIPAILNPETVTHWMPLPQLPITIKTIDV